MNTAGRFSHRRNSPCFRIVSFLALSFFLFEQIVLAVPEDLVPEDSPSPFKELEGSFHIDPAPLPPGIRPAIPPPWQNILEDRFPLTPVDPEDMPQIPTLLPREPELLVLEGSTPGTFLTQLNSSEFKIHYDLTPSVTSKSGAVLSFDLDTDLPVIDTIDLSKLEGLTFGIQSDNAQTTKMRVEVVSSPGPKVARTLFLTTQKTYITLEKSFLSGLNESILAVNGLTSVESINFYLDRDLVPDPRGHQGTVTISIAGLKALPAPGVYSYPRSTHEKTWIFTGTKSPDAMIAVNGVVVFNPATDSEIVLEGGEGVIGIKETEWRAELALTEGKENIFKVQETNGRGVFGPSTEIRILQTTKELKRVPPPKPAWQGNWQDHIRYLERDVKTRKSKDKARRYADRPMKRGTR